MYIHLCELAPRLDRERRRANARPPLAVLLVQLLVRAFLNLGQQI